MSVAGLSVALAFSSFAAEDEGWVSLFDGKTLTGWKVVGGENRFSVEDGVIRGESVPSDIGINTFLMHGKEYANFDLKVEFNIESGNSGIQFRSFDREREQFRPRRQVSAIRRRSRRTEGRPGASTTKSAVAIAKARSGWTRIRRRIG